MAGYKFFWKIFIIFLMFFYLTFYLTWIAVKSYIDHENQLRLEHLKTLIDSHDPAYSINSAIYQEYIKLGDNEFYLIKSIESSLIDAGQYTLFNIPISIFFIAIAIGLLCSFLIAWNLAAPTKLLSQAFSDVSKGDLSVRIANKFKYRHDEFASLGKEFDSMVEQISLLHLSRESLLHDLSHELRTPLTKMGFAIGLIEQNPESLDKNLMSIKLQSDKINRLIDDILTYFRCDFNFDEADCFDINALLSYVVDKKREKISLENKVITLDYDVVHCDRCFVQGTANKFQIAIENLIRNAIRFSPDGGVIKVELTQRKGFFLITISDQGPGVDEAKLSSMFEPFVQIQPPILGKGYGLGLAITNKIIQAHRGSISACNLLPHGLAVTISIPKFILDTKH